ncbi:hypothetical protein BH747_06520 [Enterococcus villorum]|uniref:HTH-type transcriptional regulator Rgg C-terminal domain-containing protein n=1 Tax=Enterococcus villorum TaxID=112904 RepID=A0A1V8YCQ5_9ENTE|nr:hypothetical protein [Enterococcus villorum]OQO70352.1 hypothetical protein BH747_06520 [Enterococcus villorum]OQO77194.1 hypothetical protein BH744_00515 [Enterococcus villorum]
MRNTPTREDILKIQKYLFEKEQFFHYEFSLFNNFLNYFNPDFVLILIPTIDNYLDSVNDLVEYQLERITLYINLGYYFFYKDNLTELKKINSILKKLVNNYYLQLTVEQLYKYQLLSDVATNNLMMDKYQKLKDIGLGQLFEQVKNKYTKSK